MSVTPNKEKRPLKTEPKLGIEPNAEQKEVVATVYNKDVTFVLGDVASGKTAISAYIALTMFRKKMVNKIWITRPILKNNLGILPGTIDEKLNPYVFPIIQNFQVLQGKQQTEKMMENGDIQIIPIDVAKGITFMDSFVIVDEFCDMDYQDFRTILTRLGKTSKMIFCGSVEQIDRSMKNTTCYHETKKLKKLDVVGYHTLTANHRNPILTEILNFLEKNGTES